MIGLALAMMGASEAFNLFAENEYDDAQEDALELQLQEQKLAQTQRQIQMDRNADSLLSHQIAVAAAQGQSLSNPNFTNIQRSTLERFQEDENAESLNDYWQNLSVQQNIGAIQDRMPFNIAQTGLRLAGDYFNFGGVPWNKYNSNYSIPAGSAI